MELPLGRSQLNQPSAKTMIVTRMFASDAMSHWIFTRYARKRSKIKAYSLQIKILKGTARSTPDRILRERGLGMSALRNVTTSLTGVPVRGLIFHILLQTQEGARLCRQNPRMCWKEASADCQMPFSKMVGL